VGIGASASKGVLAVDQPKLAIVYRDDVDAGAAERGRIARNSSASRRVILQLE
jgi:hypothetical protein